MSRVRSGEVVKGLGAHLRALRTAQELTQQAISDRTRIKVETLSRVENGAVTPDLDTLVRLADGLGVPLRETLPEGDRRNRRNRDQDVAARALYQRIFSLSDQDRAIVLGLLDRFEPDR